jgi:hypothetical protein
MRRSSASGRGNSGGNSGAAVLALLVRPAPSATARQTRPASSQLARRQADTIERSTEAVPSEVPRGSLLENPHGPASAGLFLLRKFVTATKFPRHSVGRSMLGCGCLVPSGSR